ncbi:MAG: hypothetical protein EX258_09995, partial [Sphingomonadaceae bacterium]
MTLLAELLSTVFERRQRLGRLDHGDDRRPIEALTADLIGASGEASGLGLARRHMPHGNHRKIL